MYISFFFVQTGCPLAGGRSTFPPQNQQDEKSRDDCRQDQKTGGTGYLHESAAQKRPHDHDCRIGHHEHGTGCSQIAAFEALPHVEHAQGVVAADRAAPFACPVSDERRRADRNDYRRHQPDDDVG